MGSEHDHQMDRTSAERLLAGDAGVTGDVAGALAAAAAPVAADELIGEAAAVAMFRAARADLRRPLRDRSVRATTLRRLLTAKLAVLAVVIGVGAGGVALAASGGVLPGVSRGHGPAGGHATHPAVNSHPAGSVSAAGSVAHPSAAGSPSTSLRGLCHAYAAAVDAGRPPPLDEPSFARLVAAAGGTEHVASYCAALLASAPAHPSPHPTGKPSSHPGSTPKPQPTH